MFSEKHIAGSSMLGTSMLEAFSQPGWHPAMPANVYHSLKMASSHRLVKLRKGPNYCKEAMDNPIEPSPAMILGSAMHCIVLRPKDFDHEFVISHKCERSLSSGKNAGKRCRNDGKYLIGGEWLCGTHAKSDRYEATFFALRQQLETAGFTFDHESDSGSCYYFHKDGRSARVSDHAPTRMTSRRMIQQRMDDLRVDLPPYGSDDPRRVLSPDDMEQVIGMRDAIMADEDAAPFLLQRVHTERAGIFVHKPTGQMCKILPDLTKPTGKEPAQADLKMMRDVSERAADNQIATLGYDLQGSFYNNGSRELGEEYKHFCFIGVEPKPPHGVRVYRLLPDVLECVWDEAQALIKTYKRCEDSGKWPATPRGIRDIGLQSLRRAHERADERLLEDDQT